MTLTLEAPKVISVPQKRTRKIPDYLVYEVMNGKPIYYRGYKHVLSGKLKFEDIMGASALQSFFLSLVNNFLYPRIQKEYFTMLGEMGVHIELGDNLSADLAVFHRSQLTYERIWSGKYADYPPIIVVEVDTKAAPESVEDFEVYFTEKIQKYLDFGVEQVVWIFTKSRKVWVATNDGTPWLIQNWKSTITILEQPFSIEQLIADYGFDPTKLRINQ